ncbi:NADPH-dependent FMN reductase [Sphingomonas turrisvirgatae]|uniref:NADPH-dependent FMN reductase n=1 Tax=Sphingomonas turrisvirgatae TaxID=1888892 RepID=A0A1E3LSH7_9SPHN|nr:NADPH-dependent FMN reductase [Sphingomonas turrisvirgatae]ODP36689.1 NADPH-dependent FMN reductase [Sphingomonas turrisvirgatae]
MSHRILVLYGSYREARIGIRLARWIVAQLATQGHDVELIDARDIGLPMLDKRYMDYPQGEAPAAMESLAKKLRDADGFLFVAGEYNWGMQPGLKNLTDHYLSEWARRPAGIVSYSAGRLGGARSNSIWHATLTEMGMAVVPATVTVAQIGQALDERDQPQGDGGAALARGFSRFTDEFMWWVDAVGAKRASEQQ